MDFNPDQIKKLVVNKLEIGSVITLPQTYRNNTESDKRNIIVYVGEDSFLSVITTSQNHSIMRYYNEEDVIYIYPGEEAAFEEGTHILLDKVHNLSKERLLQCINDGKHTLLSGVSSDCLKAIYQKVESSKSITGKQKKQILQYRVS